MSSDRKAVSVDILDNSYQVACHPEEQPALIASARHLDRQMRQIRASGKVIGLERIAVMAALNITNEMLQKSDEADGGGAGVRESVVRLNQKLDDALQRFRQLQL